MDELSAREMQIAEAYAEGSSYKELARTFGISPGTVRTHLGTIFRKLGVTTKIELARRLADGRNASAPASPGISLGLPDLPSVAVMPFANMSGDEHTELLAAGLTEDITARLNYLRWLVVRARSVALTVSDEGHTGISAAKQLEVRYLLEGSIRVIGDRVRVHAHLVDTEAGVAIWTQRFDRNAIALFDIQDEITQSIVVAMQVVLMDGEAAASEVGGTKDLDAWERFQAAVREVMRYTPESGKRARQLYAASRQSDPAFIDARIYHAWTWWQDARSDFAPDRSAALATCRREVDDLLADGIATANLLHLQSVTLLLERRYDEAMAVSDAAVAMGPCKVFGFTPAGVVNTYAGRLERAAEVLTNTVRIYPYTPNDTVFNLAMVYALMGEHERSVAFAEEYARRVPSDIFAYTALAVAYAFAGRKDASRRAVETLRARFPFYGLESFIRHEPFRDDAMHERVISAVREAGLT
jgi:TolB-like protein/DNA-binding CsgD family transcriptional regulator